MPDKLEEYRRKVVGTNIDPRSLLSTDYFNTFNSVVMVLDLLPDAPDLLEEVEQWQFYDYIGHFQRSGLDFAQLAIEVYPYAPADLREAFERKINAMRIIVEEMARTLRRLSIAGEQDLFIEYAQMARIWFNKLTEEANGIVHGSGGEALNQGAIDKLF